MSAYETAREIFRRSFPSQKFRPQALPEWQGDFPLPDAVAEYYGVLGPAGVWIGAYGNSHFLPSLAELWTFQAGYRNHANTGERLPGWNDDWLLIAEQGGDPFIFSRSSGHVLHAFHGAGRWEPMEMFTNLPAMVTVLAIMGETIEHADPAFTDDDFADPAAIPRRGPLPHRGIPAIPGPRERHTPSLRFGIRRQANNGASFRRIRMACADYSWWFHKYLAVPRTSSGCSTASEKDVYDLP